MRPKNFPARKLRRQLRATRHARAGLELEYTAEEKAALETARAVRTKKDRSASGKRRAFR